MIQTNRIGTVTGSKSNPMALWLASQGSQMFSGPGAQPMPQPSPQQPHPLLSGLGWNRAAMPQGYADMPNPMLAFLRFGR